VVLEALSCGLPVVVSRRAGASEILTGSLAAGIVDNPEHREEIEKRLLGSLARSRDADLALEARRLAETYSWKNHFRRLEALLTDVKQEKRNRSM